LHEQLSRNEKDLPFTLTYLYDAGAVARLASFSGISAGHPLAPWQIDLGSDSPWPAHRVSAQPVTQLISLNDQKKLYALPAGGWDRPPEQAVIVPIKQQGQPAGFFAVGINPYRQYDTAYSGFIDLLAGQIAAGIGSARAYEEERRRAQALAEINRAKTTFFSN